MSRLHIVSPRFSNPIFPLPSHPPPYSCALTKRPYTKKYISSTKYLPENKWQENWKSSETTTSTAETAAEAEAVAAEKKTKEKERGKKCGDDDGREGGDVHQTT